MMDIRDKLKDLFKGKKPQQHQELSEHYVPALLPTCGLSLENFATAEYPTNRPETIQAAYDGVDQFLAEVVKTCDIHSAGTECDHYIDAQLAHEQALHEAAVAGNQSQIARIRSCIGMRKSELTRSIERLEARAARLSAEIEPLEGLSAQFQLHIGSHAISLGVPITILAMTVDALLNFSFLQTVILDNVFLLGVTVACLSLMSDGSMWALGTLLSRRKENFIAKPLFWTLCIGLAAMFLLSIAASVMIRFGSMDATYGTINASGEFVGKDSYSLAEYGVTLVTAFLTTATGILSFAFSMDDNAYPVSVRENKRRELDACLQELDAQRNELALLENAPDPQLRDDGRRAAAEHQLAALGPGLRQHLRRLMTLHVADPDFTEKMAASVTSNEPETTH